MNRAALSVLVLLSISLITGCHSGGAGPDTSTPITSTMFPAIRDSYTRADSSVQVGLVTSVVPASNLAVVSNLDTSLFSAGDFFNFLDSNHKNLGLGRVQSIQGSTLLITYDPPAEGTRAPKAGDIAMHTLIPK